MFANILFSGSSAHNASENCYLTKGRAESSQNRGTLQCNNFIRFENKKVSFYCHSRLSENLFSVKDLPASLKHQPCLNLHFT